MIWRTKNQAWDQGTVQLKDSICFKSVQIGSQEFHPGPLAKVGLKYLKRKWKAGKVFVGTLREDH